VRASPFLEATPLCALLCQSKLIPPKIEAVVACELYLSANFTFFPFARTFVTSQFSMDIELCIIYPLIFFLELFGRVWRFSSDERPGA
jgi:hypothetical protein